MSEPTDRPDEHTFNRAQMFQDVSWFFAVNALFSGATLYGFFRPDGRVPDWWFTAHLSLGAFNVIATVLLFWMASRERRNTGDDTRMALGRTISQVLFAFSLAVATVGILGLTWFWPEYAGVSLGALILGAIAVGVTFFELHPDDRAFMIRVIGWLIAGSGFGLLILSLYHLNAFYAGEEIGLNMQQISANIALGTVISAISAAVISARRQR